ncbi:23S rRNA (adenine(1618)-N(6))-methyltransferase RlmF [Aureibaculum sp. 2210JD6-5]|uniref:23S rRNA (adenine(1618)-N(6))-methyltransferase RlmF n=1 Tax=Aureibaculum sp. 2210JD6-5 TaxID=3103957 RepID=UPI002AAC9516|nr:23S rRNA (adenine(1618)-N(6))-methyltransferase RlmF [Aureibaculum sp. 2210JD6-5]MDY7394337.1 23S rRNA (adenine(1618)-N(6))-methyltransferase RlmF [Aureibaculum sp. 2210JD6-5]
MPSKKPNPVKSNLHPRNKNRERYDLKALVKSNPELEAFVKPNKYGDDSVDFANPKAVKILNRALLNHYYGIKIWDFPDENLCPPIPGRADYIHHIADLLCEHNFGKIPKGDKVICLDVGVGASCIYPILGVTEYGWNFIGSDINPKSIASSQHIVDSNQSLKSKVTFRLQENPKDVFYHILTRDDKIDVTICNPPFHASLEDAKRGTQRKVQNLSGKKVEKPELNFAGIYNELVCDGGESKFIANMVRESEKFGKNCYWFSTLVSKQSNLKGIYKALNKFNASEVKTILMGTGNKSSRIVAWTFLSKLEQKEWKLSRWKIKK